MAAFLLFFPGEAEPEEIIGQGAIVLAPCTAAGTGMVGALPVITGAGSSTLGAVTASGTGVVGGLAEVIGFGEITLSPVTADGAGSTFFPTITGDGHIVLAPVTSALPQDEEDFVTYGPAGGVTPKPKPRLSIVRSKPDAPKLRKIRNEGIKLKREYERLQKLAEEAKQALDDELAMEAIRQQAKKAADQFARVAGDYLSIDKRRKMMAMMLALLME